MIAKCTITERRDAVFATDETKSNLMGFDDGMVELRMSLVMLCYGPVVNIIQTDGIPSVVHLTVMMKSPVFLKRLVVVSPLPCHAHSFRRFSGLASEV